MGRLLRCPRHVCSCRARGGSATGPRPRLGGFAGAAVVGPILGVLDDLEPQAIATSGGRSEQTMANIGRRWWRARDELLVFGAADASGHVALAANSLADAVAATWANVIRLNHDTASHDALDAAVAKHAEARRSADDFGQLLRR